MSRAMRSTTSGDFVSVLDLLTIPALGRCAAILYTILAPICATIAVRENGGRTGPMHNVEEIWRLVEAKRQSFFVLSDRVWETPELNFAEHRSAAAHRAMLEQQGFRVTAGIAGMPTALMGEAGEGGPVIAILGEFDALPGLSQHASIAKHAPIEPDGNGHGCGHNLLGAGSLLAATAV